MKIVVTGGAGFIGSHIVKRLVSDGHEITVLDNLSTGDVSNLKDVKHKITIKKGDSSEILKLKAADLVFHEGICSSNPPYRKDPSLVGKALNEFVCVAEYCRKNNARLIFASSSSIYNGYTPPHREDMVPLVKDFYTEARYPMERISDLYKQMFGFSYCALRYFSVYGDGEESKKQFANMVSQTIWRGMLDKPLRLYGDGSQRRDLVNINDIVEANMACIEKRVDGVFNIGNGKSYSLNEIVELVSKHLGKEIKTNYVANPLKNYVDIVEADTTKMKNVLGFVPNVSLDDGLDRTIDYYRSLKKVPDVE